MKDKFGVSDYDPLMRAVEMAETGHKDKSVTTIDLVHVHLRVAKYYHSELKSVELINPPNEDKQVSLLAKLKSVLD